MIETLAGIVIFGVIIWYVIKHNKPEWAEKMEAKATEVADVNNDGVVNVEDAKVVVKNTVAETKRVAKKVKKITTKKKKTP